MQLLIESVIDKYVRALGVFFASFIDVTIGRGWDSHQAEQNPRSFQTAVPPKDLQSPSHH